LFFSGQGHFVFKHKTPPISALPIEHSGFFRRLCIVSIETLGPSRIPCRWQLQTKLCWVWITERRFVLALASDRLYSRGITRGIGGLAVAVILNLCYKGSPRMFPPFDGLVPVTLRRSGRIPRCGACRDRTTR